MGPKTRFSDTKSAKVSENVPTPFRLGSLPKIAKLKFPEIATCWAAMPILGASKGGEAPQESNVMDSGIMRARMLGHGQTHYDNRV
jgi:hypothetical protein